MLKIFLDNLLIALPCSIGLLYVITATVLYLSIRLNRDEDGYLIIDPDSWHFKIAYPFKKFDNYFIEKLEAKPFSICPYGLKFFFMLYFGFPILVLWTLLLVTATNLITLLFGTYFKPDFYEAWVNDHPFTVSPNKIRLPKTNGGIPLLPIFFLLPLGYLFFFWQWPTQTWEATWKSLFLTLVAVIVGGTIVLIYKLCRWFKHSDQEQVSLARETVAMTYKRFCILVKVKRTQASGN